MSLLLLRSLGPTFLSQCPALLLRPPGFRSSCFSSLRRLAPHRCWPASGSPSPPPPAPWPLLLLLVPPCSPVHLLFTPPKSTPPGGSSRCFSTLSRRFPARFAISSPGSGSGGGLHMERWSGQDRPPPSKRWKSTGEGKGEKEGRGAAARSVDGSGGKAPETRPGKESHGGRDREPGAPRSKSRSADRSGERRKSENHPKSERREASGEIGRKKKMDREDGEGQGRAARTHQRVEHPPYPPRPHHPPRPHTVEKHPNPWHFGGAPRRTYPPPPPPGGARRNPGPPPKVEMSRNSQTGTRNTPPPPGTLVTPVPPKFRNPPPPATGAWGKPPPATRAWGNPPPATLRDPTPPPPGSLGNHEDFPPLSRSSCPPQRTQSQESAAQPLQRHWEESSSDGLQPTGGSGGGFDFSVMSYNILSQDLLQDNAYLYQHCDPRVLPWDFRLPNLLREIQQYDADVLCLQEVQQDHYQSQMKPALEALGYQCVYKKRTGDKPEGCAIVFKSSRLSLVSTHPLEYLRPGDALLDRDNVGLVLLLRPAAADSQSDPSDFFCVANTHLLYNPRRGDIKLAQLAILLAEISRLSRLPDGSANPVVVCGDFNSVPWSPLYCFLTQGFLEFKDLPIGLVSGQEDRQGHRVLTAPIWSKSLGINQDCCYDNQPASQPPPTSPTEVEEIISTLTVKQLTANALATSRTSLRHGVGLRSSYCHLLVPDGRAEVTTCHSRTAITVDYILYTPDSTTKSSLPGRRGLQLLARVSLVGLSELKTINGLPNQHHSSDHLPIVARFRLR